MAQGENKEINQLEQATEIQDADLFVLEQEGEAKKLLGSTLKSYAEEAGINAIREIYPRTPASNDPDNSVFDVEIPDAGEAPMHSTVIKGKTVAVNQLVQNGNFADASGWTASSGVSFSASSNIGTCTVTGAATSNRIERSVSIPNGHTCLLRVTMILTKATKVMFTDSSKTIFTGDAVVGTQTFEQIYTTDAAITTLRLYFNRSTALDTNDTAQFKNINLIDLTADGYSAAETTDVATFKAAFLKKNGYPLPRFIPYDVGSLANVNGTYRLRAKNMLDPSKRTNYSTHVYFYQADGYVVKAGTQYTFSASIFTNGLYVREYQSSESIYVAYGASTLTFTPTETKTVYFDAYWSTAPSGGTSSVSFQLELGSQATAYEPFYNGGTIDCSGAPLNGVGTAQDEEDFATGTRTTKSLIDNLGAMTWQPLGSDGRLYSAAISATVKNTASTALANIVAAKYPTVTAAALATDSTLVGIAINGTNIVARTPDGNNPTGDICYELATPVTTTETPQPVYTQYGYNVLEPVSGGVQSAEVDTVYYENIAGYIDKRLNGG